MPNYCERCEAEEMNSSDVHRYQHTCKRNKLLIMQEKYERVIDIATKTARTLGYAIAVHGSRKRDLDLIAVPWTEDASDAESLVEQIAEAMRRGIGEGWRLAPDLCKSDVWPGPVHKPHGRIAFTILMSDGLYVDLSVTPRQLSITDAYCQTK